MNGSGQRGSARPKTVTLALALTLLLPGCADFAFLHPAPAMPPPPVPPLTEQAQAAEQSAPGAMAEEQASMTKPNEMASLMRPPRPRPAPPAPARPRAPQRPASIVPPALANQPPIMPAALVGFSFDSVLEVLRMPDSVEKNALSVVWTYAEADCTLQLYFYPDIQTTVFHVLKYDLKSAKGEKLNDTG